MIGTLLSFYSLFSSAMAAARERTFIMIKPDGVQRGLVGKIIKKFEQKGFKLVAMKFMWVSRHTIITSQARGILVDQSQLCPE